SPGTVGAVVARRAGSGALVALVGRHSRSPRRQPGKRGDGAREDRRAVGVNAAQANSTSGAAQMAKAIERWTQLATRIPKNLHQRLKVYCVTHDVILMNFVTEAIEEKLGRKARPRK